MLWSQRNICVHVELGERSGKVVEGAAQDSYVLGRAQVIDQGDLRRLLLQVSGKMGASNSAAQKLLGSTEQVFLDVVGSLYDGLNPPFFVK